MARSTPTISILGQRWRYVALPGPDFEAKHHGTFAAVTSPETNTIEFHAAELSLGVVRHELFHAFYSSLPLRSARLTGAQVEEVCCELLEEHWDEIDLLARAVYKALRK